MSHVPKLRFKEFSGEWEEKPIGKILTVGSGKDYKHLSDGNIPVYGTGGYMLSVNDYLYEGESVCIGRKGTIDKPILLTGKFWTVDTLFYTHSFNGSIPRFVFPIFQKINWKLYNEASGVPSLSKSTIEKIKISIPSKPEQEKIASFLTSVDTKIELLVRKEELLQQYKKGVMQKIFSQEIRFKADDGSEYPEWEEKKLEDISTAYYQGINTTADKLEYYKDGFPILQAKHITNEIIDMNDVRFVDLDTYNSYKNKFQPKVNDLLISNIGTLGKIVLVEESFDFLIAWNIFKVTLKTNVDSKFIMFALKKITQEGYFERMQTGNATKFVNKGDMLAIKCELPCLKEQAKIANFLSSIDSKIEHIQKQLNSTKAFKKALLQQMFV